MSLRKTYFRKRWEVNQRAVSALVLSIAMLLIPQPGNTKEKKSSNNRSKLPPAPDTGSPEEDFSAGGTRDNRLRDAVCDVEEQIAYLLGNRNREFTSSAYPTFWFHISKTMNKVARMRFVVTELETGKKIYDRVIGDVKKSGIIGIALPQEQKYALSPETNYTWSLEVDCSPGKSEIALEGWVSRISLDSSLQNKLAAASEAEKHTVYLKHNLLYDALTELAQHRIARPRNIEVETAWDRLLTQLGWQDLVREFTIEPSVLDMQIGRKTSYTPSK